MTAAGSFSSRSFRLDLAAAVYMPTWFRAARDGLDALPVVARPRLLAEPASRTRSIIITPLPTVALIRRRIVSSWRVVEALLAQRDLLRRCARRRRRSTSPARPPQRPLRDSPRRPHLGVYAGDSVMAVGASKVRAQRRSRADRPWPAPREKSFRAVLVVGLAAAGLGEAAADHVADGQDRHVQPGLTGAEAAVVGLVDHAGRDQDADQDDRRRRRTGRFERRLRLGASDDAQAQYTCCLPGRRPGRECELRFMSALPRDSRWCQDSAGLHGAGASRCQATEGTQRVTARPRLSEPSRSPAATRVRVLTRRHRRPGHGLAFHRTLRSRPAAGRTVLQL